MKYVKKMILAGLFTVITVSAVTAMDSPAMDIAGENKDASSLVPVVRRPLPVAYTDECRLWQGISSLEVTSDQRVWVTWYSGGTTEEGDNYVLLATSGDGGETWSKPLFAIDRDGPVRLFDPAIWQDPSGRLWLFWAQGEENYGKNWLWTWDGREGVWAMTTDNPEAGENAVWSEPRRLCDGVMMNKPIVDSRGRWLFPVAIWRSGPAIYQLPDELYGIDTYVSTDQGKTVSFLGRCKADSGMSSFADEHNLVERQDGSIWLLSRTNRGIGESLSTDGGETWPDLVESTQFKQSSSRTAIRRLRSGNLLLIKNGPLDENVGRSRLTAYLSTDDGQTWSSGLLLDERDNVSYPDFGQSEDGTIFATWDWNRYGPAEILAARFTEEDVLAGKIVSSRGRLRILVSSLTDQPNRLADPEPNVKGIPLDPDADRPELRCGKEFEIKTVSTSELFFRLSWSARSQTLPKELLGKSFLFGHRGRGIDFEVTKEGILYVLTPTPDVSLYSQENVLLKQGFERVALPQFILLRNNPEYTVRLYSKQVQPGEKYSFAKWVLVIF